jgi:hypothetical protein
MKFKHKCFEMKYSVKRDRRGGLGARMKGFGEVS